jgi:pilus assembly protein Flp/PilA
MKMLQLIFERFGREGGQALAEYGLILAFIAIVCVAALTALGLAISGGFGSITGSF